MAKKEKSLEESKKKKVPFNVLRKGAIAGLLGLTLGFGCLGLAGCSLNGTDGKDGLNGKDGAQWYSGIETPTTQGVNGDFYLDTDDYILYQKTNGEWTVLMRDFGKPATATNIELQVASGKVQWRYTTGDDTTWKDLIEVDTITGDDGREIELQAGSEYIQWRYATGEDTTWKNLMLISSLKGTDGATWLSGTTEPTTAQGKNGDFYLNESNYDIWKKSDGAWTKIGNIKGENGSAGSNGSNGQAGKDGTNIYVGYDGYVWQDGVRTTFKLDQDTEDRENVVEDTIGAYTTMGYWAGEYVDLSTSTIALMANYKPNAKLTQYSGTKVTEIQVVAESAGTLHIGTAKVADIVAARTNGTTYTATTTSYNVTAAGVNTITLDLTVSEDETIVLGGSGSDAKIYVVKNLPVSDEQGNFALVNGQANTDVVSKTGDYADTLAVRVKAESSTGIETAVFPTLTTTFTNGETYNNTVKDQGYFYKNNSGISGKTISKIGIIPNELPSNTENYYITVYKIKADDKTKIENSETKIYFPTSMTTKTWTYAKCNVEVGEDEILVFDCDSNGIIWTYKVGSLVVGEGVYVYTDGTTGITGSAMQTSLLIDIYTSESMDFDEHLEQLEVKEQEALLGRSLLAGKPFQS